MYKYQSMKQQYDFEDLELQSQTENSTQLGAIQQKQYQPISTPQQGSVFDNQLKVDIRAQNLKNMPENVREYQTQLESLFSDPYSFQNKNKKFNINNYVAVVGFSCYGIQLQNKSNCCEPQYIQKYIIKQIVEKNPNTTKDEIELSFLMQLVNRSITQFGINEKRFLIFLILFTILITILSIGFFTIDYSKEIINGKPLGNDPSSEDFLKIQLFYRVIINSTALLCLMAAFRIFGSVRFNPLYIRIGELICYICLACLIIFFIFYGNLEQGERNRMAGSIEILQSQMIILELLYSVIFAFYIRKFKKDETSLLILFERDYKYKW